MPQISFTTFSAKTLLRDYVVSSSGMSAGDKNRFYRYCWEIHVLQPDWEFSQSSVSETVPYGGRSQVVFYQQGCGEMYELAQSVRHLNHAAQNWQRGQDVWGKPGVAVRSIGDLPCSIYTGNKFDNNVKVLCPNDPKDLPAIWAFCSSPEFREAVRQFNQKMSVDPSYLTNIPFD